MTEAISLENTENTPIEHQQVPASHQGLHNFLYNSKDEHAATTIVAEQAPLLEAEITPLKGWLASMQNNKVAGVYAVLDAQQQPQYIHYSRNVPLSLRSHLRDNGPQVCAFVRVQIFKYPKRTDMETLRDTWLAEFEKVPPGNAGESGTWAGTVGAGTAAAMSVAERQAYEDKKLKLRTAMADGTISRNLLDMSAGAKSEHLQQAVTADDWSELIDGQTQETHSAS